MGVGDVVNAGTAAYCAMGWGWGMLKMLVQLAIVPWDGGGGCGKWWYSCLLCHGMGAGDVVNVGTAAYCAMGWGWGMLKRLVQLPIVPWDGGGGCGKWWYSCLLCHGMAVGDFENVGTAAYCAMGWGWGVWKMLIQLPIVPCIGVGDVENVDTAAHCATLAVRTLFALNFACGVCDNFDLMLHLLLCLVFLLAYLGVWYWS